MNILDLRYQKEPSLFVDDYLRSCPQTDNPGRSICLYAYAVRHVFQLPEYADRLREAVRAAGLEVLDDSEFADLDLGEP